MQLGGVHTQGCVDAADGRKDEYWHQIVIIISLFLGTGTGLVLTFTVLRSKEI